MNDKIKIALTAGLLGGAIAIEKSCNLEKWQLLLIYLVPYLLIGYETLREAAEGLMHGNALDEHFLMSIATAGALAIGFFPGAETQFPEAVAVMLFFEIGELFENYAEDRSRRSIEHLMDIKPDKANVLRPGPGGTEQTVSVSPSEVEVGDIIIVRPGEKIPLDGTVIEGATSLNTVALTGESLPRNITPGDEVLSGCINISGLIKVRVTKEYGQSTVAKIIDLVENAGEKKSRSESFISRFARINTPIVVVVAVVIALLPPVFSGDFATAFPTWLYRALTFLVVSCPCALVISVPLSFFGGIGGASRKGILFKGATYMDTLSKVGTVVFDKTGTLTHGEFEVNAVHPEQIDENQLLHLAAHVERHSTHPIAISLKNAYPNEHDDCQVSDITEVAGKGIKARINGQTVCVGNSSMMEEAGAKWHNCHKSGTIVHVCIDGEYAGHIVVSDKVKADAAGALAQLKAEGVARTVMLTGDQPEIAAAVAGSVGIDEFHAGLLPDGKVAEVERLLEEKPAGQALAFVGDGINDAPVLARADVGIAMGALGSDAAIEAADIVLMDDKLSKLSTAIAIARRTIGIARQNVVFAIAVKLFVLGLAGFGLATMWMAVFADVGVTVLAVLNATRTLHFSK